MLRRSFTSKNEGMEIKKEEWMTQGNIVQNKIGLQEYVMYVGVRCRERGSYTTCKIGWLFFS